MRIYTDEQFDAVIGPYSQEQAATSHAKDGFKVPEQIKQGDRHTILYNFLRSQKARGVSLEVALAGCHALNLEKCDPPIERKGLEEYLRRVWNQEDSPEFKANQQADKAKSSGFILNAAGDKVAAKSQANIKRALEVLGVTLRFNEFSQKPMIRYGNYEGPYQDQQRNQIWLDIDSRFWFQPPADFFDMVMASIAYQNAYHPVRDYLNALQWDGTERINEWLLAYGQAGDSEYTRAVGAIVLVAAVRRVFHPGCKFDELLVLESEQGLQKSTALRALCADESWFSDDIPLNVDAKQIVERTTGKWIIEAAELSGMHASRVEHLKALLSRQVDGPVRMAYARLPVEQPRQFVLIGTTNAHRYLDDATGNRRFWPVRVENFDVEALRRDRDQLWAEAVVRERAGMSIRLDPALYPLAERQQERRRAEDPWEQSLGNAFEEDYQRVPPREIWRILGISTDRQDSKMQKRVNTIMQRLGFKSQPVRDTQQDNKVVRGWARGKKLDDHHEHQE